MMGSVNKVILVGNLGRDPEIRYTPSGLAIAKFSLATSGRVPAGEGNWEDKTEWHRIVAFGKIAEICANYLGKGRQVYVEGSLRTNQWEDAQGQKRYTTEIIAREIQMLGSAGGQQGQGQWQDQGQSQTQGQGPGQGQGYDQPQQGQGQGQGQGYGQGRKSAGPSGRPAMEELPPHSGPPEDDIPF